MTKLTTHQRNKIKSGEQLLELSELLYKRLSKHPGGPLPGLLEWLIGNPQRLEEHIKNGRLLTPPLEIVVSQELLSHPGFIWLCQNADFRETQKIFDEATQGDNDRKVQTIPKERGRWETEIDTSSFLRPARRKVWFTWAMARDVGAALAFPHYKPATASAKDRQSAGKYAKGLRDLIAGGAGIIDPVDNFSLRQLLDKLIDESSSVQKRPYSGAKAGQKYNLTNLARSLLSMGLKGKDTTKIVNIAKVLMNYDSPASHRSVQRYVKHAAELNNDTTSAISD